MQRLTDNGASLIGGAQTVITADQAWEQPLCVEAPWVVERAGVFYLFYSGSMVNWPLDTYAVGVARASNITGPFQKRDDGPILHRCGYHPPAESAAASEMPEAVRLLHYVMLCCVISHYTVVYILLLHCYVVIWHLLFAASRPVLGLGFADFWPNLAHSRSRRVWSRGTAVCCR